MTLHECIEKHGDYQPKREDGSTCVLINKGQASPEYFWLTDYIVSTVSGPVLWMVPRPVRP
jgi:hypothetical protein